MELTTQLAELDSRVREFFNPARGNTAKFGRAAAFEALAIELSAVQFKSNRPYRSLCESRGATPRALKTWPEIPGAPASAFKDLEFSCLPPAERTTVFHSSRTTNQKPSRHFHSDRSLAL